MCLKYCLDLQNEVDVLEKENAAMQVKQNADEAKFSKMEKQLQKLTCVEDENKKMKAELVEVKAKLKILEADAKGQAISQKEKKKSGKNVQVFDDDNEGGRSSNSKRSRITSQDDVKPFIGQSTTEWQVQFQEQLQQQLHQQQKAMEQQMQQQMQHQMRRHRLRLLCLYNCNRC
jgi:hypothetical protein